MKHAALTRKVLTGAFPKECAAVGQGALDAALAGVEVAPPEEGRPFPIHEILQFLKDVLELVAVSLPIVSYLWRQNGKKPTTDQVKAEAKKRGVKPGKLTEKQVDKAIKELLKDIDRLEDLTD